MSNPYEPSATEAAQWREMVYDVERAIEEGSYELREGFEQGLFENVKRYLRNGWSLSEKMDEHLEKIWRKAGGHDE